MKEQAIKKIEEEMRANDNNAYFTYIGEYLIDQVNKRQDVSSKILTEGKTIKGSLYYMRKEASKKKVNNVTVLTDEEGFNLVAEYYGIDVVVSERKSKSLDINLDDLF